MERPFGHAVKFSLSLSRPWLSLGPGWAALAGLLSAGYPELDSTVLLRLASLWILVDPLLGTLWELAVPQGLWRQIFQAQLPSPAAQGFALPYAQPGSPAGHIMLRVRRYQAWWSGTYWPESGGKLITFGAGAILALLIGSALSAATFWLVVLAISLTLLAGSATPSLSTPAGGWLQSISQLLLPWLMGVLIWPEPELLPLILGGCYWLIYLAGLRMLGGHRAATTLFFLGQITVLSILLAFRLLPAAAIIAVLLAGQFLIRARYDQSRDFLPKAQPYLVFGLLAAGLAVGSLF